eukprot:CAMPEP_0119084370 /NCGR_PEP_ID=MMETSP1178-20130426/129409_1 /TAXON_ID=33656 /ORGANISM="unid sp, Strain CCMP2000" /LENGTH=50 /DNA_ID=CAMNT_0007067333 /DNA_START=24 /DNA_END=173 /DNA_ORIENTATION=-
MGGAPVDKKEIKLELKRSARNAAKVEASKAAEQALQFEEEAPPTGDGEAE